MNFSMRNTKAELLAHIAVQDKLLAAKDVEAKRLDASIARAQALVRPAAPCANRRFVKNGQLFERVPVGFNTFAIRPVMVAA